MKVPRFGKGRQNKDSQKGPTMKLFSLAKVETHREEVRFSKPHPDIRQKAKIIVPKLTKADPLEEDEDEELNDSPVYNDVLKRLATVPKSESPSEKANLVKSQPYGKGYAKARALSSKPAEEDPMLLQAKAYRESHLRARKKIAALAQAEPVSYRDKETFVEVEPEKEKTPRIKVSTLAEAVPYTEERKEFFGIQMLLCSVLCFLLWL